MRQLFSRFRPSAAALPESGVAEKSDDEISSSWILLGDDECNDSITSPHESDCVEYPSVEDEDDHERRIIPFKRLVIPSGKSNINAAPDYSPPPPPPPELEQEQEQEQEQQQQYRLPPPKPESLHDNSVGQPAKPPQVQEEELRITMRRMGLLEQLQQEQQYWLSPPDSDSDPRNYSFVQPKPPQLHDWQKEWRMMQQMMLWEKLQQEKPAYGSITTTDIWDRWERNQEIYWAEKLGKLGYSKLVTSSNINGRNNNNNNNNSSFKDLEELESRCQPCIMEFLSTMRRTESTAELWERWQSNLQKYWAEKLKLTREVVDPIPASSSSASS
ncbi:hypothetical protein Dimus_002266 [Dionaea muscipula]